MGAWLRRLTISAFSLQTSQEPSVAHMGWTILGTLIPIIKNDDQNQIQPRNLGFTFINQFQWWTRKLYLRSLFNGSRGSTNTLLTGSIRGLYGVIDWRF